MLKQYQHIQVAVDGSKEAEVAFSKAVEVAKEMVLLLKFCT